jgi:glycosyltransferase involved in cell wall biosynthesis
MKILQVLPELNAGGVERVVEALSNHFVAHGHQSVVVSNGGPLVSSLEAAGARHIQRPVHRKSLASLFQVAPFRRLLEQERPDILHFHSRVPGWIAWLAWRKMVPATRPRLVSTVHGFYSVNAYSRIMTRGERVIAVSECIRDYAARHFLRRSPAALRVVRHGIDPATHAPQFHPAPDWLAQWQLEFPQLAGRHLLLLPGRLTRLKGHEDFLRLILALRKILPTVHGLIVGDAHPRKLAYQAELHQLVKELRLASEVTFVAQRTDLREIMAVSNLVCSLSTSPESFGLTTLEALALGRPVVGYDHGGVGELLREFFPAGRVPLRNGPKLFETTHRLLVGPQTPAPVTETYTRPAMGDGTLAVYAELLQPPGSPAARPTSP